MEMFSTGHSGRSSPVVSLLGFALVSMPEKIEAARQTIAILPPDQAGKAVLNKDGSLFNGSDAELSAALAAGEVVFHEGRICGAWPQIVG